MAKESSEDNATPKKGGLKLFILIPLVLILAIGGSVLGTMVTAKMLTPNANQSSTTKAVKTSKVGGLSSNQVVVPLAQFLVNLSPVSSTNSQYMRIKISVVVASAAKKASLKKNMAVVRDSVINLLRKKKASDILNGTESIPNLKLELKNAINQEYGSAIIQQIFITDLVIQ